MLIFFDSNIVIYLIEQPADWGQRVAARVNALQNNGDRVVVSDLVRMECRVGPLAADDPVTLSAFEAFFASSEVDVVGVGATVCDRAAAIRARYRFRPLDALHLAAAVEAGCNGFLTNDERLIAFPEIATEALT